MTEFCRDFEYWKMLANGTIELSLLIPKKERLLLWSWCHSHNSVLLQCPIALSDKCLQHCIIKTKEDIYVKGWFICWFVWQILYAITRLTAYLLGNILAPNHVDAVITFADVHLCTFISISPLKFYAGTKPY